MLSIGKLGQGQEAYYIETVAKGAEEYYLGHGEAPGRWVGTSAGRLGLADQVDGDELRALLRHLDPRTDELLTRGRSTPKVAGFDLTFCAPKSVSLLWAFGSSEVAAAAVAAHEAAVDAALALMQTEAARVRRGEAGCDILDAEGFVAAAFRHRTSRAGDPHLHTHVVVGNIGYLDTDGRWSALDARHIFRWAQPVGYVYEAHLRYELSKRLDAGWGLVRNGIADLAGVPRAAIDQFSTRRREIIEHLEARGVAGGRAAQVATYATRRAKAAVEEVDLRAQWTLEALDAGLQPVALGTVATVTAEPVDVVELFADLGGSHGITERRSSFDRRGAIKAVCDRLPSGAPADTVIELVDGFLSSEHVVVLPPDDYGPRFTTVDMVRCERRLVDRSVAARFAAAGIADREALVDALTAAPMLSIEQRQLVAALTRSGRGVDVVIGAAGAGKTSALSAARSAWDDSNFKTIGCSLAARAAKQLEDGSGIPSVTLDRLLAHLRGGRAALTSRHVVVVDEAGMVGTRQLDALVGFATAARAKVVLVGDPAQLPAIEARGALAGLARRLGALHLTENHRQVEAWERAALVDLRSGSEDAPAPYVERDRVNSDDVATVLDRWWDARERGVDLLLVAGRRDQVRALNNGARERMRAAGSIGADRWRADGCAFAVGDEVVALQNDHRLGLLNGTRGCIVGGTDRRLDIEVIDGGRLHVPMSYVEAGHLDHGYALTIHKAQGLTADETIVFGDEELTREHAYVGLSRGRLANRLTIALAEHFDDHPPTRDEPLSAAQRFGRVVERSAAEDLAIDL